MWGLEDSVWGQFQRWVQEQLRQACGSHWKESCSHAQGTGAAALPLAVLCFDVVTTHTGTRTHMGTHTEAHTLNLIHPHMCTNPEAHLWTQSCPQMSRLLPASDLPALGPWERGQPPPFPLTAPSRPTGTACPAPAAGGGSGGGGRPGPGGG